MYIEFLQTSLDEWDIFSFINTISKKKKITYLENVSEKYNNLYYVPHKIHLKTIKKGTESTTSSLSMPVREYELC